MPPLLPATQALLLVNVAIYFLGQLVGVLSPGGPLALYSLDSYFLPWQVVTYAFLHRDGLHLFFNMFGLWMFGSELERIWGTKRYLQFYFASLLAAAFVQLLFYFVTQTQGSTVGASGALYGLLLAFAMMFPTRIVLLFLVIPMQARWLVLLYGALEMYQGVFGTRDGIAHFAHLGGMLGGYLMIRYWRGQIPFGRRR